MLGSTIAQLLVDDSLDHIIPELQPLARPMSELIPDPENARKHDAANLKMIAESLQQFKQRSPLVVNRHTGYIAKGNGTYIAAKMLGWTIIAYVYVDDNRPEALAYGLVDNESSDSSTFIHQQKGKHLRELNSGGYDLSKFWGQDELGPYMHEEFKRADITDEVFDPGMKKGRSITKISTANRLVIDRAIAFFRSKAKLAMTEGDVLEQICGQFIAQHINEIDTEMTIDIEAQVEAAAISFDDDEE